MEMHQLKYIAHRGLFDQAQYIPENSLRAFELAVEMGFAIELDVQLTIDDEVVVFHDRNLKRMTGMDKNIDECSLQFIKELTLSCGIGEGGSKQTNMWDQNVVHRIPALKEVLCLVNGKVPLVIEIKDEGFSGRLEHHLMNILETYKGEYAIEAFNPYVVWWLRRHVPQVKRGQLAGRDYPGIHSPIKKFLLRNMVFHIFTRPDFVAYQIQGINRKLSTKLKKKGVYILTWTIRDQAEFFKGLWLGNGVIFEKFPDYQKFLAEASAPLSFSIYKQ